MRYSDEHIGYDILIEVLMQDCSFIYFGKFDFMTKYRYKCRHCWKEFERDQLIKRSFCEQTQRKTNLIRLI